MLVNNQAPMKKQWLERNVLILTEAVEHEENQYDVLTKIITTMIIMEKKSKQHTLSAGAISIAIVSRSS